MKNSTFRALLVSILAFGYMSQVGWAQSANSTISGTVTDPSGALVPNAQVELRSAATSWTGKVTSGSDGLFRFPDVQQGAYELHVSANGFIDFIQQGIMVNINATITVPVVLKVGAEAQKIEVFANASPLNTENAQVVGVVTPTQLAELPLVVSGNQRAASSFIILMPGVSSGGSANPYNARVNGGLSFRYGGDP